jgi:hypothetical protein
VCFVPSEEGNEIGDVQHHDTCAGHVHAMSSTRHGTSLVLLKPNRAERADNQNKSTHMVLNITYLIAFFARVEDMA